MSSSLTPSLAYVIRKMSTGDRVVCFANGTQITADTAGLCAGKDLWISQITAKCRDCKQVFPLSLLNGGGQWCEPCQMAGVE